MQGSRGDCEYESGAKLSFSVGWNGMCHDKEFRRCITALSDVIIVSQF